MAPMGLGGGAPEPAAAAAAAAAAADLAACMRTLMRSSGWVQQAATHEATPPR